MSRYHIIAALVLVAVVAALGLTHKFYFEEKIQAYNKSSEDMKKLKQRLTKIEERFYGKLPEEYLEAIKKTKAPLEEAATARAQFFNLGDFWTPEEVPEDVKVPMKFYYEEAFGAKERALLSDAMAHVPQVSYPPDLFERFGATHPSRLADASPGRDEVRRWLTQINFGSAVARMLIKANAAVINDIILWPPRDEFDVLEMRTVGLSFYMRAEDLVAFLDYLQRSDRYFNVNAIRVRNRNLLSDPRYPLYLEVEMLLTLSRYNSEKAAKGVATLAAAGAAPGGPGGNTLGLAFRQSRGGRETVKKESFWEKLWPF